MSRFELDFLAEKTDEALLDEIRRVAALHRGGRLTTVSFSRLKPKVSYQTILNRFGSWKKALMAAGLSHLTRANSLTEYSNEAIIEEIRRVAAFHRSGPFTAASFRRLKPKVSYDCVIRRFGTWKRVLSLAGLSHSDQRPHLGSRYTDEQCMENLANVWTQLGRQPQHDEMKRLPSTVGPKAYVLRWGTWHKALKAFVDWAHADAVGAATPIAVAPDVVAEPTHRVRAARRAEDCRDIRPGLRFRVFLRDRFRCVFCGRSPATHLNVELHADHATSVADGGKTVIENLRTTCQDCNLGKGRTSIQ